MIQVRGKVYRGKDGFAVVGKDDGYRSVNIFVKHLSTARAIQAVLNNTNQTRDQRDKLVDQLIREER